MNQSQETPFGLFYIALPEDVLKDLKVISEKTGKSLVECLGDAIHELKVKHDSGKR